MSTLLAEIILGASILLQFTAAIMALWLIKITGRRSAWLLVATAIVLMAIRRTVTFVSLFTGDAVTTPDLQAEIIALFISILMVVGIAAIAPLFLAMKRSERAMKITQGALASSLNAVVLTDFDGKITFANTRFLSLWGYDSPAEIMDQPIRDFWESKEAFDAGKKRLESGATFEGEIVGLKKDGSTFDAQVWANMVVDDDENPICILGSFIDITERKRADEKLEHYRTHLEELVEERTRQLQTSEERYRLVAENVADTVWVADMSLNWTFISPSVRHLLDYSVEEAMSHSLEEILTPKSSEKVRQVLAEELAREGTPERYLTSSTEIEVELLRRDGSLVWGEIRATFLRDQEEKPVGILAVARDVSFRKGMEKALREKEERFRTLIENSGDVIYRTDFNGYFIYVNPAVERMLGYTEREIIGRHFLELITPFYRERTEKFYKKQFRENIAETMLEFPVIDKSGQEKWVSQVVNLQEKDGKVVGFQAVVRDITDRIRMARALQQSEERYRMLAENAMDLIWRTDIEGTVRYVNPAALTLLGFTQDEAIGLPVASYMSRESYETIRNWVNASIKAKPPRNFFKGEVEYIHKDGSLIPCEVSLAMIRDKTNRIIALEGISRDITERKRREDALRRTRDTLEERVERRTTELVNAIAKLKKQIAERRQAEQMLQESYSRLRRAMGATVQAMAMTIEMRDPYTAGHQTRVTRLAMAIAKEMGLPKDTIDGLQLAGIIHDLGKIAIPAEILSKPGQINEMVFDLIKMHPQVGFEILRKIDFPWPVAEIVHQHHEKMDGSGYPRGIGGESILIEARILAVADVVEAIASHRPYRPALGIDVALQEIIDNKGTLYDPKVVDACVHVFKEDGFLFHTDGKIRDESGIYSM